MDWPLLASDVALGELDDKYDAIPRLRLNCKAMLSLQQLHADPRMDAGLDVSDAETIGDPEDDIQNFVEEQPSLLAAESWPHTGG